MWSFSWKCILWYTKIPVLIQQVLALNSLWLFWLCHAFARYWQNKSESLTHCHMVIKKIVLYCLEKLVLRSKANIFCHQMAVLWRIWLDLLLLTAKAWQKPVITRGKKGCLGQSFWGQVCMQGGGRGGLSVIVPVFPNSLS